MKAFIAIAIAAILSLSSLGSPTMAGPDVEMLGAGVGGDVVGNG